MSVESKIPMEKFLKYVNENIFKPFNTNELTERIIDDILKPALESVRTEADIAVFLNLVNKYNPTLLRDIPYSPSMPAEIAMYSFSGYAGMVKASAKMNVFSMCSYTTPLYAEGTISELLYADIVHNLGIEELDSCWRSCSFDKAPSCIEALACITYTPTMPGCEHTTPCTASTFSYLGSALPSTITPEGGNDFQVMAAGLLCD